jgi:hypothetical protein
MSLPGDSAEHIVTIRCFLGGGRREEHESGYRRQEAQADYPRIHACGAERQTVRINPNNQWLSI